MIGRLPGPQKSPITDGLLFPYCMFSRYLVAIGCAFVEK